MVEGTQTRAGGSPAKWEEKSTLARPSSLFVVFHVLRQLVPQSGFENVQVVAMGILEMLTDGVRPVRCPRATDVRSVQRQEALVSMTEVLRSYVSGKLVGGDFHLAALHATFD